MSEITAAHLNGGIFTVGTGGEELVFRNLIADGMPVLLLDLFGSFRADTQAHGDILGEVIATDCQNHGVPDIPIDVDGHIGSAATNVANHDAHLAFGLIQDDLG